MVHFTYTEDSDNHNLHQGDLLKKTNDLLMLIKEYHPRFINNSYEYFMVLTQSCDLHIRDEAIKVKFINICPTKSIKQVLKYASEKYRYSKYEKSFDLISDSSLAKIKQFLERLLNNNVENYFFLYRAISKGLNKDYCAFLRLAIPIKAQDYDILLKAKILQLTQTFEHKLGYLYGSNYSKIGTDDWIPDNYSKEEYDSIINNYMFEIKKPLKVIDSKTHKELIKKLKAFEEKNKSEPTDEDVVNISEEIKNNKLEERAKRKKIIKKELEKFDIDEKIINNFVNRLSNTPEYRTIL